MPSAQEVIDASVGLVLPHAYPVNKLAYGLGPQLQHFNPCPDGMGCLTCSSAVDTGRCKEVAVKEQLRRQTVAQRLRQPEQENSVKELWMGAEL